MKCDDFGRLLLIFLSARVSKCVSLLQQPWSCMEVLYKLEVLLCITAAAAMVVEVLYKLEVLLCITAAAAMVVEVLYKLEVLLINS